MVQQGGVAGPWYRNGVPSACLCARDVRGALPETDSDVGKTNAKLYPKFAQEKRRVSVYFSITQS